MNQRITTQTHAEVIAGAIELLPGSLDEHLAHVAFFTADPIAAGLHSNERAEDGRSFREIAHHSDGWALPRPLSERRSTVVMPTVVSYGVGVITVVHELGHALHEKLDWEPRSKPTTEYAHLNDWEAFAEAFTAWVLPPRGDREWAGYEGWEDEYAEARLQLKDDPATLRLFETLAHG